jgi:ribosome biogenesis GTPase
MIDLFGWTPAVAAAFSPLAQRGLAPARVLAHHRDLWRCMTADGERPSRLSGRFAFEAEEAGFPVTGDWVGLTLHDPGDAIIHAHCPRSTAFIRRAAGGVGRQVVAANVDVALLVAALTRDLNPRRLERYIAASKAAGVTPVIVLTKADLPGDHEGAAQSVASVAGGAAIIKVSALTGEGFEQLSRWLTPGTTLALLGSSGAGKSTLLNMLAGTELMATAAVRAEDDRGRHTTRHRELHRLANGALVIDTPGMRELGLIGDEAILDDTFDDISALASTCRFGDCGHSAEPGCAIQIALEAGALEPARWAAFQKLGRELRFEARKEDAALASEDRTKWKRINKNQRAKYKLRDRNTDGES